MNSNSKEASSSSSKPSQPKTAQLKSANKRTRQVTQQSAQAAQSDKGKVVSPRPPATGSALKDGSASTTKRNSNFKDLSVRAREEAKTIDNSGGAGSAGQAKRGQRTSTSNGDLLKQSIRSEKVIKSSLNAKKKEKQEKSPSKFQNSAAAASKEDQDQANSVVKLKTNSESVNDQENNMEQDPASDINQEPVQNENGTEEVKTVKFDETTTDKAIEIQTSEQELLNQQQQIEGDDVLQPPKTAPPKSSEESKALVMSTVGDGLIQPNTTNTSSINTRPKDANRASMQSAAVNANGGNAHQLTVGLMHEDEEEDHVPEINIGFDQQETQEDPKRKFLFARQLTHYFEDNPPLPLLPKSVIRRSESPRTGGATNFLKLTRFRGQDFGKSKFREKEQEVERVQFPKEITTLKQIFQPLPVGHQQSYNISSLFSNKESAAKSNKKELKRQNSAKKDKPNYQSGREEESKTHNLDTTNQQPASLQISSRIGTTNNATPQKGGQSGQKNFFSPNNLTDAKSRENQAAASSSAANQSNNNTTPLVNNMTQAGELVYQRQTIDFKQLNKQQKRDTVIEENLLDVKKLLKNSQMAANSKNTEDEDPEKKQLVKVNVEAFYTRKNPEDQTLIFESRFESGNLAAATKVNDNEYHCLLQNDVNTGGHTQWYFFRTSNNSPIECRFNMLNLCKPDSLYNEGMKILVYSEKMAAQKDIGWHRGGTKISYYQNGIRKDDKKAATGFIRSYFTHTFTYNYEYENDTVYFAYCYPYTFTDLTEDLNKIMADPVKAQFTTRKTLCQTLAGNPMELLTITSKQNPENMTKRKGVVLTARVHPGESVGSWMMKGCLEFLTSTDIPEAEILRQHFVFKIIPMLNPDGVINGNYRCSLAGCDLNRRWKAPSKVLHPTIYYTKQMIHNFAKERELLMVTDFHGHSRRKNIFMYGCNIPSSPEDTRIFPFILSNICPFFIYHYSRFGNQKSKESTLRMALFNELKQHPAIYTVESSFCGNDVGKFAKYHFSTDNLMQTGLDFCRAILIYSQIPAPLSVLEGLFKNINGIYSHYQIINENQQPIERDPDVELMKLYKEKMEQMKEQGISINTAQIKKALLKVLRQHSDVQTDGETTSSVGSDNAPSEDNLKPEEIAEVVPIEDAAELAKAIKRAKNSEKSDIPKGPASTSPLKKRSTTIGPNGKQNKGQINLLQTRNLKSNKKQSDLSGRRSKQGSADGRQSEGGASSRKGEKTAAGAEVAAEAIVTDENVVHKKKLKKNVESRDACTQTERSDYYLIKQRQKQKEIMMMAKQGLLPPGVNPQALMQSYIQSQNSGVPFQPMEAIQKQLAQVQLNQQQQQQAINQALMPVAQQKQQISNNNQILRQQILVNSANNAAAVLYQQQMNQAYYMQMQQYSQQQQQMLQQMKGQPANAQQVAQQNLQQLQQQPLTQTAQGVPLQQPGQAGHVQPLPIQANSQWYNHPNRNVHSSYSPQKARKDGAPPATNVYSNSSAANSMLNTGVPPGTMPHGGAHVLMDGQRASASRGGGPRGSAQTMINPMQQSQAIEMSKTQEQAKNQQLQNQGSNQWVQGKLGSKDITNASNVHIPPGAHVHGGVIASMGRKGIGNASKGGPGVVQPNAGNSYAAAPIFNAGGAKGMVQNPNPLGQMQQLQQAMSRQSHNLANPGTNPGLNNGQDTLPDILMQSPNPSMAKSKHVKQTYMGPLNRTQNPTQIERLQAASNGHQVNPSFNGGVPGSNKLQKVTGNVGPHVATSVDGIHAHHGSNGQLAHAGKSQQQAVLDQQWRQRAIQNGKSQDNLHPTKDGVNALGVQGMLQPNTANTQKHKKGVVLENQFIKQTLEQQEEPTHKKGSHQNNQNSYIRNVGATNTSSAQQHQPGMSRGSEKVQYIQHGDVLERRVKKRQSNTGESFIQNHSDQNSQSNPTSQQHPPNSKQVAAQGRRANDNFNGRSNMDQYRGGLHPQQQMLQGQYSTPSKPVSRGAATRGGAVAAHPAQQIQQQSYGGGSGGNVGQNQKKGGASNHNSNNNQQFFHVQRIIPANMETGAGQSQPSGEHAPGTDKGNSGQGVKINIVNVHNEFNIQNNIIIQQPSDSAHGQPSAGASSGNASQPVKKTKKASSSHPATKTSQSIASKINTKK